MKAKLSTALILMASGFLMAFQLSTDPIKSLDAPEWEVDPAHSSISFTITHFFTPVQGRFDEFESMLMFSPEHLEESKAEFTVKVASINTQQTKRDNHLKSVDFFHAEKFPDMHFESTKFRKKGRDVYVVHGNLKIRDVIQEVAVPFQVLGTMDNPMKEGYELTSLRAEFTIDRTEFGVGTGSWAATTVVGDEVNVTLFFEANRKK
ncbi:YceI family protein [Rapidithrix thailandica]|uniref:YceI family protein n=1 Tax=Rapidithrix thailandica TaxID=413964 RepID=A0AAW9S0A1_9BACT